MVYCMPQLFQVQPIGTYNLGCSLGPTNLFSFCLVFADVSFSVILNFKYQIKTFCQRKISKHFLLRQSSTLVNNSKKGKKSLISLQRILQWNLDLVTDLVTQKSVTKLRVVTKSMYFMY